MPTVEEVTKKYIELRDRREVMEKEHQDRIAPISEAMTNIEAWFLDKMNTEGCTSLKNPAGTPYKNVATTLKIENEPVFRHFVFAPLVERIVADLPYVVSSASLADQKTILSGLLDSALWDVVDFRVRKKGVQELMETGASLPPGLTMDSVATVRIRRS